MAYAQNTSVSPERSQAEIGTLLRKYGATGYTYGWDGGYAQVAFRAHERIVRFTVPMPDSKDPKVALTETGRPRRDVAAAMEQEVRRRWRALVLVIKAKLEAVQTGVTTFEDEFLAHIVLPDGHTVAELIREKIAIAYETGKSIDLLPGLPGGVSGPPAIEASEDPVDAEIVG